MGELAGFNENPYVLASLLWSTEKIKCLGLSDGLQGSSIIPWNLGILTLEESWPGSVCSLAHRARDQGPALSSR